MRSRFSGFFSRSYKRASNGFANSMRMTSSQYGFGDSFTYIFPEAAESGFWLKAGVWAFGSAAMYVGYELISEHNRMNRELRTHPEMQRFREELEDTFATVNNHDEVISTQFNGLLEAIAQNDTKLVSYFFANLQRLEAKFSTRIRDNLIVYTANHGKAKITRMLANIFGEPTVRKNAACSKMLDMTSEDTNEFTGFVEQFYQSPGEIKHAGFQKYVQVTQDVIRDKHVDTYAKPIVLTGDVIDDTWSLYQHTESVAAIHADLDEKFKWTLVINLDDTARSQEKLVDFLWNLSTYSKANNKTVVGTFMTTGSHYTIGQIKVEFNDSKSYDAHVVYIDPKGTLYSITSTDLHMIVDCFPTVFGDRVLLHNSEQKLQFAGLGCSLFTAYLWPAMMNFDRVFAANTQYTFAGEDHALFKYVSLYEKGVYPCGLFPVMDDDKQAPYRYHKTMPITICLLPATLAAMTQSFESPGTAVDIIDVFTPNSKGTLDYTVTDPVEREVTGRKGLNFWRMFATPNRKKELDKPLNIGSNETVNQAIDRYTKIHKNLKPRNGMNSDFAYEAGNELTRTLLRKH